MMPFMTFPDISLLPSQMLKGGDIFGSMLTMFTGAGIETGFIYMSILALVSILIYTRTKSITGTGVFLFILGSAGAMTDVVADMQIYFVGVMVLGVAMALYNTIADRW